MSKQPRNRASGNREPIAATLGTLVESDGAGRETAGGSGDGNDNSERLAAITVDPSTISGRDVGDDGGGSGTIGNRATGKKRGRKPGTRNAPKTSAVPLSSSRIETLLFTIHGMLANLTGVEEIALDGEEAAQLGSAVADVASFYDVQASEKSIAWTNLAVVLGVVYGPRFVAMRNNRKAAREAAPERRTAAPASSANGGTMPAPFVIPGVGPAVGGVQ